MLQSAILKGEMTDIKKEIQELEEVRRELNGKKITSTPVIRERDTSGMAGTKYKTHHTEVLTIVKTFVGKVKDEKKAVLGKIDKKLGSLSMKYAMKHRQYNEALVREAEARRREVARQRQEAEDAKKRAKANA